AEGAMRDEPLPHIPRADEAERGMLGAILVAPARLGEAAEKLTPEDFDCSLYRNIYAAMLRLETERRLIDELTIAEVLAGDEEFKSAGGVAFLSALADGVYARGPLGEYCRLVKQAAQRRRLQQFAYRIGEQIKAGK